MLWRKGVIAILPCAGITLIRFTGIISDWHQTWQRTLWQVDLKHPGNTENLKAFVLKV